VELARIDLNPQQPRQEMDDEALRDLADSIRRAGVLQPVVVRPRGGMFELVVGERRLRAARMAGLDRVPAVVREIEDDRMLELALIENVQREDLNPIEKAQAVRRMMEELELTQEEAGRKLSLRRPTIANLLRLLELPEELRDMVSRGTLSAGHARAILSVQGGQERRALAEAVLKDGLSVRETEKLAASGSARAGKRTRGRPKSPQVRALEEQLEAELGRRVEIRSRGAKGRLVLHFEDHEDFERLFDLLTGGREAGAA
jgi:ParB family chromosome partitioning protein